MGKLTYSARKNSGIKAGQAVSKDLKKRIPPGIGSKAAARDPVLEIYLDGKCLTDEGFAQFIDNLLECIRYRDEQHPVGLAKVTEFQLKGNNLTVKSLSKLGEVIVNSTGDLRELDLSNNDITVVSAEDKAIWKAFLESFQNCYMLKKLDISGNPIGPAGLEILARVYIKSDLEYVEGDAGAIIEEQLGFVEEVSALKIAGKENESPRAVRSKKSPNKGKAAKQSGASTAVSASKSITTNDLRKYACTRGLRSIPYFILSDISIKNSSAVHLSRMLATQRASKYLLGYLPPGKSSAIPGSAEDGKSLLWQPNEGLVQYAQRLLDVTEQISEVKAKAQAESDNEDANDDEESQRKLQSKLALEYTRLTKRVRIESLKQEGVHASDIAITALKMFVLSRALLLEDEDRPVDYDPFDGDTFLLEDFTPEELAQQNDEPSFHISSAEFLNDPRYTFVSTFPPGPFHPEAAMFNEEFPALEAARQKKASKSVAFESENEFIHPQLQPGRSSGKGMYRPSLVHKKRKLSWRYDLPFEAWRKIIAYAVGADGILDKEQHERIIHYATDWDAIEYELTIKGAEDHQQIWKFLETVRCFTYTPN
ncbi:hypothetical protein BDW59DRAFT_167645 [Aspergillus cavernicola]|uniref:Leucine rich repeat protein n=1 Tax=Aspergillus cavernicola TaxID=176166 RepID=A0ABR4HC67_9EURO